VRADRTSEVSEGYSFASTRAEGKGDSNPVELGPLHGLLEIYLPMGTAQSCGAGGGAQRVVVSVQAIRFRQWCRSYPLACRGRGPFVLATSCWGRG